MRSIRRFALAATVIAAVAGTGLTVVQPALATARNPHSSFIGRFRHTSMIASTVPKNGDVNPHGVAGTTIMQISPGGHMTEFARISRSGLPGACPGGIGLTTALVVVRDWVIVGSLPSKNGLGLAIAPYGDVLIVNGGNGRIVETTRGGHQIATRFLDRSGSPPGSGALFGLAVAPHGTGLYYVDDAVNALRILH
jgi:hypothetical protein